MSQWFCLSSWFFQSPYRDQIHPRPPHNPPLVPSLSPLFTQDSLQHIYPPVYLKFLRNFSSLLPDLAADLVSRYVKHTWRESVSRPRSYRVVYSDRSLVIHEAKMTSKRPVAVFSVESNSLFCMRRIDMSGQQSKMKANDQSGTCYFTTAAQNRASFQMSLIEPQESFSKRWWIYWSWRLCGDTGVRITTTRQGTRQWFHLAEIWTPKHQTTAFPLRGEQLNNLHINKETTKPLSL